ncbi:cytochrome P450 714B3 isoform X1 [Phragmites australis]|uniref:cytochrome P450 714B3 isoform X1 n=1 Tax=Phragmites australis TaxID=29695 RepID=UPI002D779FA5|nr:cytochrome P450 714B3 isoform X1 [Phragmites australis]
MEVAMAVKVLLSLCFVAACSLAMYLYHVVWVAPQRVLAEFRRQGIGGPRPSFPYGNLADMREAVAAAKAARAPSAGAGGSGIAHDYRPAVLPFYEKWRKEYGSIFTYSMGNVVFLHVSRPDVVRDINLCVSLDLGKSSYLKATHEPLFGRGILKSNGEAWLHQRKIIAPEFFLDKVKGMVDLMVDSTQTLLKSWEERIDKNGGITDIKIDDDIRAYSADVISRTCFGSSYIKGKKIFLKIRELQQAVSKPNVLAEMTGLRLGAYHKYMLFCAGAKFRIFVYPNSKNSTFTQNDLPVSEILNACRFFPTIRNKQAWELHKQVHKLILEIVKESGEERNLLRAILHSASSNKVDLAEAENFIVDNCKSIYFAGYESTAVTAAWCLMLLGLHPEWQDRVREEVHEVCSGRPMNSRSLQKMKNLTMVIQETLRLYPAGAFVSRQALQELKLGGVHIPKGVNIYIPVSTMHLDSKLWGPDVKEFNPERFSDARPQLHSYLPFGAGARTCLGQGFAMAELKILIALIISKFALKLSPHYEHSPTLKLIVEPEFGVDLTITKIQSASRD